MSNIGLCNAIKAIPQCIDRNPSSHTVKETNTYAGLGNSLCVNRIIYSNTREDFPLWYSFAFTTITMHWKNNNDSSNLIFSHTTFFQTWKMVINLSLPDKLFSCKKVSPPRAKLTTKFLHGIYYNSFSWSMHIILESSCLSLMVSWRTHTCAWTCACVTYDHVWHLHPHNNFILLLSCL